VRHQARAGAALAAITLALAIAVAVAVIAQASTPKNDNGNLSDHQLLVATAPVREVSPLADSAVAPVAAAIEGASVLKLDIAMSAAVPEGSSRQEPISVAEPIDHGFSDVGRAYVASPELLQRYGIDPASIDEDTDLLTNLPGNVVLLDTSIRPDLEGTVTPVQHVALSPYSSGPRALITESAMRRHGWVAVRSGWLIESPSPITGAQLKAARGAAASNGLAVESRSGESGMVALGRGATAVGALLALAILAMTIGLIRGESADDVRTLNAVGASSRTRRAVTASAAGALALVGVVLATGGAYIALVAAYRSDLARLASPPVGNLLLLAIGLPAIAAAAGWALAGREPTSVARQLQ
jgi:putative ABC transport system permease protein